MQTKYIKNTLYAAAFLGLASACEPEIERPEPISGEADFSTYVALGNSLTAGYMDDALYREGQENSYPAILARQMESVGRTGEFNQPLIPEGGGLGFTDGVPNGKLELGGFSEIGLPLLTPTAPSQGALEAVQGSFHNFGVPGAKSFHLLFDGYGNPAMGAGNYSPYFARFASAPSTSVVKDAAAINPTFFTLWIGNNDVLDYALDGGPNNSAPTDPATVEQSLRAILTGLGAQSAAEGAIANIPDIEKIPFFTTLKFNALNLNEAQVQQATAAYQGIIDPQIRTMVINGVIKDVVTRKALRELIIPGVARAVVKQQIASNEPCSLTPSAEECAEQYIQSGAADNDISGLTSVLSENYFLPAGERDETYAGAYTAIDAQLVANQGTIDLQTQQTITAYNNEQLPAADQQELTTAIDSIQNVQITQLKAGGIYPTFKVGPNPFVIQVAQTATNPLGIRHMKEGERVLLTAANATQTAPDGTTVPVLYVLPITDEYILELEELEVINQATQAYNSIIADLASDQEFGLALVDFNGFLDELAEGVSISGVKYTADFITGNAFSLDGVHYTQRGAALVANKFIDAINEKYNATIPKANPNEYPTVGFPD